TTTEAEDSARGCAFVYCYGDCQRRSCRRICTTGRGYRFIPIPQELSKPRVRRRTGAKVGSVAVLPFASESADAEMELLNRIIVERVIDTVSRTPGVRVLAYNTVQHHRGKDLDFRRLGENLLVDAIAAGEMIRHNDELLLHVELIDVSNGSQLWGEQFKEHYSDVLEEPETLADKICDRLRPILVRTANSRRNERSRHTQRNQAGGAFRVCRQHEATKSRAQRRVWDVERPRRCAWLPFYSPAVAAMRLCFGVL